MIESLGSLISLFDLLTNGIKTVHKNSKQIKTKRVQRKIITIQLLLEDLIENAEQIFNLINVCILDGKVKDSSIESLRMKTSEQLLVVHDLSHTLHDITSQQILKVFLPDVRRKISKLIHFKGGRVQELHYKLIDYNKKELKKLYNKDYYAEGLKLIEKLKESSSDLSQFINAHINIDEVIHEFKR